MRPNAFVRLFTVAQLACLVALTISLLHFGAMVATNNAPSFSRDLAIGEAMSLEIHNGSACPRSMPSFICYATGLEARREFRIVYHTPRSQNVLVIIDFS